MKEGGGNPKLVLDTPGRSSVRKRKGKTYKYSGRKAQKAAEQRKKLRVIQGVSSSLLVGGPESNVKLEPVREEEGSPSQLSREEVRAQLATIHTYVILNQCKLAVLWIAQQP
jgi:hypothetical protein